MRISKRAEYGLRAMVALAHGGGTQSAKEIAEQAKVPKKFLEQLLLALKSAGLVTSTRGKEGGFALRRSPREVNLADIIRALDGPLAPLPCASRSVTTRCEDCPNQPGCWLREVMLEVRDAVARVLEQHSLAETTARASAPPPGSMYQI
jgi:Rrf2 family transcriptional regulator, cysteine metabolism repressor